MEAFVWTDREVRAALGLSLEMAEDDVVYTGVSTDSRALKEGELFVALVGDSFDGHDFVADALGQGAAAAVVSRPVAGEPEGRLYPVDDTMVALGSLAGHRRSHLPARRVGITGSSGKTGTKDLLRGALEGSVRVHATRGNLNNRIGLPLTILEAPVDTDVLVLEMGTNEPGEIAVLTEIGAPEIGVLTTVGESHLEKLGSFQGVLDEKLDLLRGLPDGGWAVVGDEPSELPDAARTICGNVRVAGWSDRADPELRPREVESDHWGRIRFRWQGEDVTLHIPGRHVAVNALLALAVAEVLEIPAEAAAQGVSGVEPGSLRGEVRAVGGLTLILDCYNANPQSVRASLDLLVGSPLQGARVAFLGTMLELGDRSAALHREILVDALDRRLDVVVATGAFALAAAEAGKPSGGPELIATDEPEEAYARLRERLEGDEVILLKGSRGVALEDLVPLLERDFGGEAEESGTGDREDASAGASGTGEA